MPETGPALKQAAPQNLRGLWGNSALTTGGKIGGGEGTGISPKGPDFWALVPVETDARIVKFVDLLKAVVERVADQAGPRPVPVGAYFHDTVLHRHAGALLERPLGGLPQRALEEGDFTEIVRICGQARTHADPKLPIVSRRELGSLAAAFGPYVVAMREARALSARGLIRLPHNKSDALRLITDHCADVNFRDLDSFNNLMRGMLMQKTSGSDLKGSLRLCASLHLIAKNDAGQIGIPANRQMLYRLSIALQGAWLAMQLGNGGLERFFLHEMQMIYRERPDPLVLRRLVIHAGYHGPLTPQMATMLAKPVEPGWYPFRSMNAEPLRLAAFSAVKKAGDLFESSRILGGATANEVLHGAWRAQVEKFDYASGAATALATYLRELVHYGELEKAEALLSDVGKVLTMKVSDYARARLIAARGEVLALSFGKALDWQAYQASLSDTQTAVGIFESLGNFKRARTTWSRHQKLLGDLD